MSNDAAPVRERRGTVRSCGVSVPAALAVAAARAVGTSARLTPVDAAPAGGAPTGTVTFLFSDVEGSTRRWENDPVGMRAALEAHDSTLRAVIAGHGGWVFKHTGDGVCAAFSGAADAVAAAIDAQVALELPVRMGICTGPAELDRGDYFGPTLNRSARVMSAAHGGQVLVAQSAAALVDAGILVDLGEHRLRDLAEPIRLHQVVAPGLRRAFPPPRSLSPTPGNLPSGVSSFVGRRVELAEVIDALRAHRLVTLTGVGGVGKTRLALRSAEELSGELRHGVWFVDLAAVGDPAAVPDAVAVTLGLQASGEPVVDRIVRAVEGREVLLLLDNCEHVLEAVGDLVDALLSRSSTARVLATSREGLAVPGEQVWPVPSLDVAPTSDSAAVALFIDRAASLVPGLDLGAELEGIAEICARLDGIPLAIELAAARMVAMSVTDLRSGLDDRFRLLTGARRGIERHQTLRHAVQWSHDLLSDDEQALLHRLSVCSGGFDVATARALSDTPSTVPDLLASLVRKSLLTVDRTTALTRYRMLETIRQFAEERLVASGVAEDARASHARWFGAEAWRRWQLYSGPDQGEQNAWLDVEWANLRDAHGFAIVSGALDAAGHIAILASIAGSWSLQRWEGAAWADDTLDLAEAARWHRLPLLLIGAAQRYLSGGDRQRSDELGRRALELTADPAFEADSAGREQAMLGSFFLSIGDLDGFVRALDEVVATTGDPLVLARGTLLWAAGSFGARPELAADADAIVDAARAAGWPYSLSIALSSRGSLTVLTDPAASLADLREGRQVANDSGNQLIALFAGASLARAELLCGDVAEAVRLLRHSLEEGARTLNDVLVPQVLAHLGAVLADAGRPEDAAVFIGLASSNGAFSAGHEAVLARLRDALGGAFDSLYESGLALSNDAAVDRARRALESL